MKITKNDKRERAKRFNISIATYYNWEKTKPELIKIIELGLFKEKEVSDNTKSTEELYIMIQKIQEDIEKIKKQ